MRNLSKNQIDLYLRIYEILDRRHIHDEGLLVSRIGNFMLVNSFLFVAFATLEIYSISYSWVFPIIGIAIAGIFYALLNMQLKTARLWLDIESEIEEAMGEAGFPKCKGQELAPNIRHAKIVGRWMWPTWTHAPSVIVIIMLAAWITLLVMS